MAKTKISEFSSTPANNTDIDSINIAEGCAPSNINDAIRELMAQLKDFQTGAVGDSFNGPIGSSTASTGAFTNITASGTLGVTGVATLGAGAILNTPASVTLTNATGLPISTGVSGLGTGVATALAVNVGSAGAPVVNGGALGTPSSGTVTNLTGTASININGTVGATTPTTGAFTTLAASSSVTLSGGTANGVTYLNGSKVLTSGSALTFDGTKLGFNGGLIADNNLVAQINSPSTTAKFFGFNRSGDYGLLIGYDNANDYASIRTVFSYPIVFSVNNTEAMRLTSTGLGIGTSSPYTKLDVSGASGMKVYYTGGTDLNSAGSIVLGDGNRSSNYVGLYRGTSISGGASSNALTLGAYDYIGFNVSATTLGSQTERMRLDSAGNLGLGVTPTSGWYSSFGTKVFQFAASGVLYGLDVSNSDRRVILQNNAYVNTSGNEIYLNTGAATKFLQRAGAHSWHTAASGTAGDIISFTQAMTLDASGNLGVGTTSPSSRLHTSVAGENVLTVQSTGTTTGTTRLRLYSATATTPYDWYLQGDPTAGALRFYNAQAGSEAARIDSSGNMGIGTTTTTAARLTLASTTLPALTLPNIAEIATVSATAATGTINYDLTTQSVLYYTTNASGNFTMNIRGNSGLSLNSMMSTGQSVTMAFLCTNGGTAYYQTAMTIDGTSVTPKWQGGTAPSSGNTSSVDVYSYTVIKTGAATFTVLASQTKFA